ncbi:MAG: PD40 domain-containing protein [Candidatus Solibacter usitatus]|nr:PD40 domain-containing protein [Candidatus Solibacter usitatus]
MSFADGRRSIRQDAAGERMQIGTIDSRCVAPSNLPPTLTPEQAASRTWRPGERTWAEIKAHSAAAAAAVTITGYQGAAPVSRGAVRIRTSRDPVGAPVFYRDVPLMPPELEKGVIKPLAPKLPPFIAWRLRWMDEPASRVLMEGLHTCANGHSFSRDGKTPGLDLDGPHNDQGLYAIVPVGRRMRSNRALMNSWHSFSPNGRWVVFSSKSRSPYTQMFLTHIDKEGNDSPAVLTS